jgi:hypothetical protein
MSYIYEALKRAESENARAIGAPGPLRRPAFFAARWRWWFWLLIGVLGTNAALVITLVLFRGSHSPVTTPVQTGSTVPATSRRDAELADVTPAAPPPTPANGAAVTPAAEPPAKTVAPSTRPPTRPVSPAPNAGGRPAPAVKPSTTGVESSARPSTPTRPVAPSVAGVEPPVRASAPTAITEARPTAAPTPGAPVAAVSPSSPPAAPAVSGPVPQSTPPPAVEPPKLQVQVVVYSDVPAQRLVFINGHRYVEGDKVDAETVVERITPEGAVVTRRGQSFALTSGRP